MFALDRKGLCTYLKILLVIEFVIYLIAGMVGVVYAGPNPYVMLLMYASYYLPLVLFFTVLTWFYICKFEPWLTQDDIDSEE